ncbi:MAG: leucine--tRNA ligase [Candidatus Nomurabacteria bacterium]|jgi:leucyl-tRNA synthetase|nr:leucine--tRNA ligase [Candidatus Nomurabacteria bacterium]
MTRYNPAEIETKWQEFWAAEQIYRAADFDKRPKFYLAEMFPYPSGAGLHVGHVRNFTIVDVLSRFWRQRGYNILRPFGYDTFGLPAENYAIKTGVSPQKATADNIANFRRQAKKLGFAIDWSREINSSDPEYYHWTQWIFAQLFKKGLAYRKQSSQWWCPVDKTVLANEQVDGGRCWRCGSEVQKKTMKQWFFKITDYADELLSGLDELDWPDKIKVMQRNWIGKSQGAEVDFAVDRSDGKITVFTTRPDTLFGATFLVLAPEHPLVKIITTPEQKAKVADYLKQTQTKSDIERQSDHSKTGVFTGSYAINPASNEKIPIWVADYVLGGYGSGAVMAVPAHDQRDYDFATKFNLEIKEVVKKPKNFDGCYAGEGVMINSGKFNGLTSSDAREQIVAELEKSGCGRTKTTYRMRDWLISRQRYWGCPIPIAYDKNDQPHLIPEDQLPVLLPPVDDYAPDDSGRSALAKADDWLKVTIDGQEMTRETDTLDGYACSSWYLLRYADPHNSKRAWDKQKADFWNPVDIYVGGDHATAHLLYVRFWCKFLADQKLLDFREPIKKLLYNGMVLAPDGRKMSKSKGNTIDPLDIIDNGYGADTLRTYEMFMGPFDQDVAWDISSVGGVFRFLTRVWNLVDEYLFCKGNNDWKVYSDDSQRKTLQKIQHKTIKKLTEDLERANFNTAVAALMEFLNGLSQIKTKYGFCKCWENLKIFETFCKLLAPFAPHIANEMFEKLSGIRGIENDPDGGWPTWDEKVLRRDEMTIAVQVNGKLRATISVGRETAEDEIKQLALAEPNVAKYVADKKPARVIYVAGKIVNVVV